MTSQITAHGVRYTETAARAMVAKLEAENETLGASDGRVTLIEALKEGLRQDAQAEREAQDAARLEQNILRAQAELRRTERNTPGEGRIEYVDLRTGNRRVASYSTRDGFLRGYIKFGSHPNAYDLLFVDEN